MAKYDLRDFFWSIPVQRESRRRLVMRHPGTGRLMWCRSLPFGYLDSPRQACRVSEALAGEMRKRAAGMGIHFLCYVDDYLVIGDTLELTRRGQQIFEEVMKEFGMQWAPSKQRGPVQCIEFLGLLLCNVNGHRCIALTEKRQENLKRMIEEWWNLKSADGLGVKVKPKDLAKLLGHLVFASQVVPGGRTYMQNMLSAFSGLEVDWKHGRVRARHGDWELVTLSREFWLDLEWWSDHLEVRNCVPLDTPSWSEAMITGTDASDWGVGTVVWLDGHKEECNMSFCNAEKRRPINFRELLGIVRIFELYGHRLAGCKVMVETDNTTAKGAAEKLASVAASMQEMLRRLYAVAERWGIIVVPIHTPGAKLFRPDQTSRGDPIEEPRLRLNEFEYSVLERRFGPFTEFVGAERRHSCPRTTGTTDLNESRIWMHPAHNTVGSALRLLGERMAGYDGDDSSHQGKPVSGVVVVPFAPEAQWWGLTRHFACVGRWEVGSGHLEMNQLGRWRPVKAVRPSLALVFPRAVGCRAAPVELPIGMELPGYVRSADDESRGLLLPLTAGSFLYSPGDQGTRGELLMVWHSFHPDHAGRELDEEGEIRVSCAELLLMKKKGSRSSTFELDRRQSFAAGGRQMAWELSVGLLWTVDHLVQVDGPLSNNSPSSSAASPRFETKTIEERRFTFDYVRAEREIAMVKEGYRGLEPPKKVSVTEQFATMDLCASGDEEDAGLELAKARASADEAAAMKALKKRQPAIEKDSVPLVVDNRKMSVCRYSSQRCEGCEKFFVFGEKITAGYRSMVHPVEACMLLAGEKHAARLDPSKGKSGGKEASVKSAQAAALTDGERLERCRLCLNGECNECDEERVTCLRGCGKGVHLVACLRTSASYRAAGRLICLDCRLSEIMEEGCEAPASVVQQVTLAMVAELTSGAVSTAAGRNQFASLERRWALEGFAAGDGRPSIVRLPRHNIESFLAFMWWIVTEAEGARSFGTTMRAAGSVMEMHELKDWTKTARVKAQIKEIERKFGVEAEPCTQTTRRIVEIMVKTTIPETCSRGNCAFVNHVLTCRTEALLVLELLAGLRVGEATSSGDLHGLEANSVCFLSPADESYNDGLGETIEVAIHDSKTGPGCHAVFVSKTMGPGALKGGAAMRNWIKAADMQDDDQVRRRF